MTCADPEDMKPEVGMQLQSQSPEGQVMNLVVTDIAEETITLDGNHPLAGKALTFAIERIQEQQPGAFLNRPLPGRWGGGEPGDNLA